MSTGSVTVDTLPSLPVHSYTASELGRSASYTSIPGVLDAAPALKRNFSDNNLHLHVQKQSKVTVNEQNANVELFRRASTKTKKRMSAGRFLSAAEIEDSERAGRVPDRSDVLSTKSGKGVGGLKMFSRKAWLSSSRNSSPSKKEDAAKKGERRNSTTNTSIDTIAIPEPVAVRISPRSSENSDNSTLSSQDAISIRRDSSSPTPHSRTISEYSAEIESDAGSKRISRRSSFSSLRSRASIDKMYLSVPSSRVPPLPSPTSSSDRISGNGKSRQQDPHWIAFRAIDGEYASFQAKTSMQKAKVVRTVLLPFLSKTSDKVSTTALRAEDLDRRVTILNKWWVGLIDLLNGTGQQSISGTDRPAFLEAICEVMVRSEWKMPPLDTEITESTGNPDRLSKTDSQASSDSEDPEFLIRSIHQNIRTMFIQNIIQQLTFVIDKLSMRAAPGSLIIFGGKTLAYAFFFCPGVADMLVRLWHIPPGTLRRILSEYGPATGRRAAIISRNLASSFPPPLRSLIYTSHVAISRQLQNKGQAPPNTAHIRWCGPWVNRWSGRDSDLFYVFVKYYHLLAAEHLPRHLLPEERMGIPAFIIVHAQILLTLEAAVYRQAGSIAEQHYAPQAGENPDAMAPMPMVIPNATRIIGENRLVILLRDSIADRKPENAALAEILIGPFQYLMKAAVRKVSMYNNDACFTLCDFLEELVPIIAKYQRYNVEDEDWAFWLKVYKMMMQSQSTMTQIRLIAFLYTSWRHLITNEERKEQVVLNWLLDPQFFAQFFNHWSPMVRHYYFRLLCWRVGRCDDHSTEMDLKIYQRLLELLNKTWAHHQYLTADAEMRGTAPPSTNPCAPAPGRGLVIIRVDSYSKGNDFTSFDKLMPPSGSSMSPYINHSSAMNKVPEADTQQSTTKKRWNILKNISLFSGPANNRPGEVTPPSSPDSTADASKKLTSGSLSRPPSPPPQVVNFQFKLEYVNVRPGLPAKLRKLPLPQLPHTSQKLLDDMRKLEQLSSTETLVKEIRPRKPLPQELGTARYSGRALSEWNVVTSECRNFFTRRKQEGCPGGKVETPAIAVESFRMFG